MPPLQLLLGPLVSAVVAGGWWFAAVRLGRPWTLYGLAVGHTLGLLMSLIGAYVTFTLVYRQFVGFTEWLAVLAGVASVLELINAAFLIAFVVWLVSRLPSARSI